MAVALASADVSAASAEATVRKGTMNQDPLATVEELAELIEAIDRTSPQLRRSGESEIVAAAAQLRSRAQARISELTVISRGALHSSRPVDD